MGKDAQNATYCARIRYNGWQSYSPILTVGCIIWTTPHMKMFGVPEDVSSFKALGCECFMYLKKNKREQGKHTPRKEQ
jgi:hypothetical protein